ncbi:MAG: hypothetical protein JNJ54_19915 [Myxococcaceae bacterium]|nr:hypothetical protein [Myxococcaceae bacterium]
MFRLVALFTTTLLAGCAHLQPEPAASKAKAASTFTVSFSIERERLDAETLASLEKVSSLLGARGQVKATHLFSTPRKAASLSYGEAFKGTRGIQVAASPTAPAPVLVTER